MDEERRIRMMLDQSITESDDGDSDTTIDDSDADPDYILPEVNREYSDDESDDDEQLLQEGSSNVVVHDHGHALDDLHDNVSDADDENAWTRKTLLWKRINKLSRSSTLVRHNPKRKLQDLSGRVKSLP